MIQHMTKTVYSGDIYEHAALQSALAATNHVIPWANVPKDVQHAFLVTQHELGDLLRTAKSTAVRASADGYWCLAVKGNPILLESQLREDSHPDAIAGSPNLLTLRRIKLEEVRLFDANDQKTLARVLIND